MPITLGKRVLSWELMNNSLKPSIAEFPELVALQAEFEAHIAHSTALHSEQEILRARLRETTRLRQEAEAHGQDLRLRLSYMLQAKLGFTSEKLIAYGLAPRRKKNKRRGSTGETQPPATPPSTPAPTAPEPPATQSS